MIRMVAVALLLAFALGCGGATPTSAPQPVGDKDGKGANSGNRKVGDPQ